MARTEVSSVIKDILEAFQNGSHIYKGVSRKHKRRHSSPPSARSEEKRIHNSLVQRPQEIRRAYDQAVVQHGRRFEVGDSASQTSLAQILLRLNTGLIMLLNSALSSDKQSRSHSRSGIFNLSESAAIDTLSALSELNIRLASPSRINLGLPAPEETESKDSKHTQKARAPSSTQAGKRPPPNPLLHHGGWVRSKTDPSVVSVVVSKRARKIDTRRGSTSRSQSTVRPRSTSSKSTTQPREQSSPPPKYSQLATNSKPVVKPKPKHLQTGVPHPPPVKENHDDKRIVRHPSMYIVPSHFFEDFPQLSMAYDGHAGTGPISPPRPPKIPLQSSLLQPEGLAEPVSALRHSQQVRPPSMMTFMTASTKIGEIPPHRLPDRELTKEQQREIPMPYVVPEMLNPPKKRGGRGFRFWKKERQERAHLQAVAA